MKWVGDDNVALFTDLYELTMAASYFAHGLDHQATFDLFVRALPAERRFLVACGIEDAIDYLEGLRFGSEAIDYLRSLNLFDGAFLGYLEDIRFTGEAWAVPEGEVMFGDEPLLEVTAPLIQAQLVETFLINCVASQTMVASKAARVALACAGRPFVDFSARRDHGADAALRGARRGGRRRRRHVARRRRPRLRARAERHDGACLRDELRRRAATRSGRTPATSRRTRCG